MALLAHPITLRAEAREKLTMSVPPASERERGCHLCRASACLLREPPDHAVANAEHDALDPLRGGTTGVVEEQAVRGLGTAALLADFLLS